MTPAVAAFIDEIDALLEDDRYVWATVILRGIKETARVTDEVTRWQRQAVEHVAAGVRDASLPSQRFRGGRRYEGWQASTAER
jgi:hypothetical protein